MRARWVWLVAGVLVASMACGRESATPAADDQVDAGEATDTHPEEENAIHLGEDMVRDLRISTALVVERPGARNVTVLGEVAADQNRYAEIAPPAAGQIVRVLAELDARVGRDTPLAELRSSELGRARAELLSAEARRDLARQALDRRRALAAERIVATREVQEAEAAYRAADADARAAAAALRALGIEDADAAGDSSLFFVRSPIAGRVIARRAIIGQYADGTSPLFTVADLTRVWLIAQAFERDAVTLRPGGIGHVTLAALPGREFDGRVTHVGRQVDPGSRTVPVRVELANPEELLRPGMSATVRLDIGGETQRILVVPAAALQRVGSEWLAFVPKAPREFEMRRVGRGRDLGNDVEVVSGLDAGETVVVDGAFLLKAEAEKRAGGGGDEHGH